MNKVLFLGDNRFSIVEWKNENRFSVVPMSDFVKISGAQYELEKYYKVKFQDQKKYMAKLILIGTNITSVLFFILAIN